MKAMEQQAEIEKERLKQEGKGADRLKKSEVVLVEDPITGEPRYVTTQEATTMGYQPAAAPGTETFGQKKELKAFEHQLDARMEKLKKELEESGPDFEKERKLRKDAENVLKAQDFFEIQGNVSNIKQIEETGLAAEGTPRRGAQDVSLLFSYLKILDPGSVVREGERGMVEASGTFGQRARTILERFNENKVLPDEVREGMIKEAKKTYQARVNNVIKPVLDRYGNIADRYGINKEAVTPVPLDWEEVGSGGSEEDKEIEELDKRIQQLQKELGVGE
jgi:L-cysteine desulfidase